MKPMSFICTPDSKNMSIKFNEFESAAGSELEANEPVVPGFLYVQLLAPGQPATATAYHRVLVLESLEMKHELDALQLGMEEKTGIVHY